MSLASYRRRKGLTQQQLAVELGLRRDSRGYISRLESGAQDIPLRVALTIEAWSGGELPADSLVDDDDRQLLERHRQLAAQRQTAGAPA